MTLPLNLRSSPSGPLIDIVDPDVEAEGRVIYVNGRSTQDLDLQTGSPIAPYSRLATAVSALLLTGGVIVIAPSDYSAEVLPNLGNKEWTFTNVDPHPNYVFGAIGVSIVALPAVTGTGFTNFVGCRIRGQIIQNTARFDSCWIEANVTAAAIDGFDNRFINTSSINLSAGMGMYDTEFDSMVITTTTALTVRLYSCAIFTSFAFNSGVASSSLRVDQRTCANFDSIIPTLTNTNLIIEGTSVGSGRQIVNSTANGALGIVDISALQPGGSYVVQPAGNFNIDGFTAKQNGFWFDLVFDSANSLFIGTLNYDVGAALTSMRTPSSAAYSFLRNTTLRMRYQFNRWRVEVPGMSPFSVLPLIINTAINRAATFVAYRSFTAGGGGAADDVTIVDVGNLGFNIRVLDAWLHTLTPVIGSTCHVRTQLAGAGVGLTSLMSSAAAGITRNNDSTTRNAVAADGLVLRRSDSGVAGDISVLCVRT